MLATITQKKPLVTPRTKLTKTQNCAATSDIPLTKSAVYNFTSADKRQLIKDLNSPSAGQRVRALNALKTPSNGRYSMFDVPDDIQITEEERIAAVKPKTIQEVMQNVVAYVEVRSDGDDRSEGICKVMKILGAQVNSSLVRNTTHVIFRGGRLSTYKKAKSWNIPMVSVLWIEACKVHLALVDPKDYPATNLERYEKPELYKPIRCPKSLLAPMDLSATPKNIEALSRPIIFRTPVADSLRKEMREISKKIEETENQTPIATVPLSPEIKSEPPKSISYKPTAEQMAKALSNMKNLITSPAAEMKKENLIDLTDSPEKSKPTNNRRRTLFTPNPVYEEQAPVTVVKAESNRRRTLFTPNPNAMEILTKKSENRRRTLYTSSDMETPTKKSVSRGQTLIDSCTKTLTKKLPITTQRRTLFKPQPDTPIPKLMPSAKQQNATPKAVIRKRKFENLIDLTDSPEKSKPTNKRRRTLFTPNPVYEEQAPVTVVKAESNRRRTLFTPNPNAMEILTKKSENRRRTLYTSSDMETPTKKSVSQRQTLIDSCTKTLSKNLPITTQRRTLFKPQPDTPIPKLMPSAKQQNATPKTVIRKRKLEIFEVLKENTPPKMNPFLTKKAANNFSVDQQLPAKRRRTMLTIPSKFI